MEDEQLSREEVALVLRRAGELDGQTRSTDVALDDAAVEEAAVEAGFSRDAVRSALAELRAGVIAPRERGPLSLLGASKVRLHREVAAPKNVVEPALRAILREQLFELERNFGGRTRWGRQGGLIASARRALDLSGRLKLNDIRAMDVVVASDPASGQERAEVGITADVSELRLNHAAAAAAGTAAGGGIVAATAAVAGLDPILLASVPAGIAVATGSIVAARISFRRRAAAVTDALAGLLDRLDDPAS